MHRSQYTPVDRYYPAGGDLGYVRCVDEPLSHDVIRSYPDTPKYHIGESCDRIGEHDIQATKNR